MNHDKDYDRNHDREDVLNNHEIKKLLVELEQKESEMMKHYMMTAERIHNNVDLKNRLHNFSEGNAKRADQLKNEIIEIVEQ